MGVEQFEWTPEGRQLLSNFRAEIQRYGGIRNMRSRIIRESNRRIYSFKETNYVTPISEDNIIFLNWDKLSIANIAKLTNRSGSYIWKRGAMLGLPRKVEKNTENRMVLVLNTETGIFYQSASEAAQSINISARSLQKKVTETRKNNTSFIKV